MRQAFKILSILIFSALSLCSCENNGVDRPYGYMRLGKLSEFNAAEVFIPDMGLLVRHDAGGYSVMSTLCTFDLSPLKVEGTGPDRILASETSPSKFTIDGRVLAGPAAKPLPYYKLVMDRGEYNGPVDTLYAKVGEIVPASYRFNP